MSGAEFEVEVGGVYCRADEGDVLVFDGYGLLGKVGAATDVAGVTLRSRVHERRRCGVFQGLVDLASHVPSFPMDQERNGQRR